jgi:hypothetical protein
MPLDLALLQHAITGAHEELREREGLLCCCIYSGTMNGRVHQFLHLTHPCRILPFLAQDAWCTPGWCAPEVLVGTLKLELELARARSGRCWLGRR